MNLLEWLELIIVLLDIAKLVVKLDKYINITRTDMFRHEKHRSCMELIYVLLLLSMLYNTNKIDSIICLLYINQFQRLHTIKNIVARILTKTKSIVILLQS